jgi:hypothetical protein
MTDVYSVYNKLVDMMCSRCKPKIFRACKEQGESARCKCMISCMGNIIDIDDGGYPVVLPELV